MRRRRRQRRILAIIALVLLAIAAGAGLWQYQRYTAAQQEVKNKHATATALATITPTPSVGPATPPAVTGKAVTLQDKLQYIDIKEGTGAAVQKGSTVSVQYTGWLKADGKKFDSSYDHGGQPFSFTVGQGQVIPGWDEGLIGMKEGGTRRLIIPAALAYGAQGSPPVIPPNADLIFDVKVESVQAAS
ncbi:MAG: FKBP-type peptidyl-prolyl cis-trans isomerase [Ktedonobacteraceae bacterium]|nr:FKBP-type peptidyl-prolyl cis-trans isomerase [Ktedonobacteraceae bacterium]